MSKEKKQTKSKTSTQDSLPYKCAYEDGTFELADSTFSRAYRFNDVSFRRMNIEDQEDLYERYQQFLSTIPAGGCCSFYYANISEDINRKVARVAPDLCNDELDFYRKDITNMIRKSFEKSGGYTLSRMFTYTVPSVSVETAMQELNTTERTLLSSFADVTGELPEKMDLADRLDVVYKTLNSDVCPYITHDAETGKAILDLELLKKRHLTTKDIIAPTYLRFPKIGSVFETDGMFASTMFLRGLAPVLKSDFLTDLLDQRFRFTASLKIYPVSSEDAIKMVNRNSVQVNQMISDIEERANNNSKSAYISPDIARASEALADLKESIGSDGQNVFYYVFEITHYADSREKLKEQTKVLSYASTKHGCSLKTIPTQQERMFMATIPFGYDGTDFKQYQTTDVIAMLMPFREAEVFDTNGTYYGVNSETGRVISYNKFNENNYNSLIIGPPGSGKSMFAKAESACNFLSTNDYVYIIDPQGEYAKMAEAFNGQVIKITPNGEIHLNPLDLDISITDDSSDPIADKSDFIAGLFEMISGRGMLYADERSVLDRVCTQMYREYTDYLMGLPPKEDGLITIDREHAPTLARLYDILRGISSSTASGLADMLERYVVGSYRVFSHTTNINPSARFIVYDVSAVGNQLKELALYICMSDIRSRVMEHFRSRMYTHVYFDEFHTILKCPSAAEAAATDWRIVRKFGGAYTGITQSAMDLMNSSSADVLFSNSSCKVIFSQDAKERNRLAGLLDLKDGDLDYITGRPAGTGLICTPSRTIPFNYQIPKDTQLYKLITTKMTDQ